MPKSDVKIEATWKAALGEEFEKPYFKVNLYDNTSNEAITCADFMVYADPSDDIFTKEFLRIEPGSLTHWLNWTTKTIDLVGRVGHSITATFVVSDCVLKGHYGYAYIDGECLNDLVTVGPCLVDGTRKLSVSGAFKNYVWSGSHIKESNIGTEVFIEPFSTRVKLLKYDDKSCRSLEYIEIQGTAEGQAFSRDQMNELMNMAEKGCKELFTHQEKIIGSFFQLNR